jgi:hypothetical protein
LREALETRGGDLPAIEDRLGFRRGRLARLLDGASPLRLDQLLAILEAAGIAQSDFFAAVYRLPLPGREARPRDCLAGMPMESWIRVLRELRARLAEAGAAPEPGGGGSAGGRRGLPALELGADAADDAGRRARRGPLQEKE